MSNNGTTENVALYATVSSQQVTLWLWKVCSPVIILLGTFGNVMTIVVLRRMSARQSAVSMSVYFIALAVSDLIQLYTGLFGVWLTFMFEVNLFNFSESSCKVVVFLMYVSGLASSWLLVAMTTQRVTSVVWPHKANVLCSLKRTYVIVAVIITLSTMVNSHKLYSYTLVQQNKTAGNCEPADEMLKQLDQDIFSWIEMILASAVPFCLLAIGNVLLVWKVAQSVQTARKMGMVSSAHVSSRQRQASSLTVTLIVTSSAFLCLTLPMFVTDMCFRYFDLDVSQSDVLVDAITSILFYCNAAINFYLYCLSGSKFKEELKRLLCLTA